MDKSIAKTQFYCYNTARKEACFSQITLFSVFVSSYAFFRHVRVLSLNKKKGIFISSLLMAMRCKHGCISVCLLLFFIRMTLNLPNR